MDAKQKYFNNKAIENLTLRELESNYILLFTENVNLKEEIIKLKHDNFKLRTDNETLIAENQQLKDENDSLSESNSKMRKENERLTEELNICRQNYEQLINDLNQSHEIINSERIKSIGSSILEDYYRLAFQEQFLKLAVNPELLSSVTKGINDVRQLLDNEQIFKDKIINQGV